MYWGGVGDFYRKLDENPITLGLKTAIQAVDPFGVTSWVDMGNAWEDYKNGEGSLGNAILETIGALPILGKVGKIGKLFTAGAKTRKILRGAKKAQDAIDSYGELAAKGIQHISPKVANWLNAASQGTQKVTAAIPDYVFRGIYNPYNPLTKRLSMNATKRLDLRDIYNYGVVNAWNYGIPLVDAANDYAAIYKNRKSNVDATPGAN